MACRILHVGKFIAHVVSFETSELNCARAVWIPKFDAAASRAFATRTMTLYRMKEEREGDSSAEMEGGIGRDKANFGPWEINYCPHLGM